LCSKLSGCFRLKTRVRDGEGRKWFVRTFVNDRVQKLLPLFGDDAAKVVAEIDAKGTGFTEQDMKLNSRGAHWFSIAGHDRNNKSVSPFDFPDRLYPFNAITH
jgi:hypothetical protein